MSAEYSENTGTDKAVSDSLAPPGLGLISQLRSQIESILLVVDSPVSVMALSRALNVDAGVVEQSIQEISAEFQHRGSGIELRESEEGWRLYSARENAEAVEKFLLDGAQSRLSRAALETLAVIAYRQPATRAQVSAVRGVNVDGVMRTLQLRGLIREVDMGGTTEAGNAHHYETTELFLELLGIDSLEHLPELAPLLPDMDSIDELL
ncbi:SMC-Scp complex subunit ScpB [Corynebacterium pseudotuberculosis]|uniref:SMC-Scp complex subunit ScpB n=1 Tax=Corynebacterium pseudotuberculosis 258 TaxID=1168865 RepID=A0AAU8PW14_CORPS|nr:SMC-Scp complex subunit ScpB [Corynebacterium pseudotuberculosis]AER69032.1 Segregation and condensation protein B [Corynebacterium pseudotuberculosis 1/06-A]AEQ06534.1 SMC-Scp complex subunit ScpB [Corynebacterium pseudotuberculosis CIP 52.97]AFB72332.1 SMC-Scp complex subunit ScpB [Corynebacterium pseudotuberculosis 316]AFH90803.2 SMC-Scp complex subunit ScpB [Corynebacterium pseudotuberculosis 31]AFK16627.1 SMC-Scp complex subunit ScpB [Corynebacterium pseudotuberculosis 258]